MTKRTVRCGPVAVGCLALALLSLSRPGVVESEAQEDRKHSYASQRERPSGLAWAAPRV